MTDKPKKIYNITSLKAKGKIRDNRSEEQKLKDETKTKSTTKGSWL